MRLATAVLLLFVSLSASAQNERIAGVTLASGYATGFEAGAVHTEARVRIALSERVTVEPMASWTRGFAYGERSPCLDVEVNESPGRICSLMQTRFGGVNALAYGSALTYRPAGALPLGLDGAHVGVFVQATNSTFGAHRLGAEVGAERDLGRQLALGVDLQAAYVGDADSGYDQLSVSPLLRLSVGR